MNAHQIYDRYILLYVPLFDLCFCRKRKQMRRGCLLFFTIWFELHEKSPKWQDDDEHLITSDYSRLILSVKEKKTRTNRLKDQNCCRINYSHQIVDVWHVALNYAHISPLWSHRKCTLKTHRNACSLNKFFVGAFHVLFKWNVYICRQFAFVLDYFHLSFSFWLLLPTVYSQQTPSSTNERTNEWVDTSYASLWTNA